MGVEVLQCCREPGEAAVRGLKDDWAVHCAWQTVLGAASSAAALHCCTAMLLQLKKRQAGLANH